MNDTFYKDVSVIDAALSDVSLDNKDYDRILNLISNNSMLRDYFFTHIKNEQWFDVISRNRYFDPQYVSIIDEGDLLLINVLGYLERIAMNLLQHAGYDEKLMGVINEIIKYAKDKQVKNPYIWHELLIILSKIPSYVIANYLPIDGDYGFDALLSECVSLDLPGNLTIVDIGERLFPMFINDDSMRAYADIVAKIITDIRVGKTKRTLSDKNEAGLKAESYWVLKAFEKSGNALAKKSERTIYAVANNLKRALEYNRSNNSVDIKKDDDVYELFVSRIQSDDFSDDHISYKRDEYIFEIKKYAGKQLEKYNKEEDVLGLIGVEPELSCVKPAHVKAISKTEFVFQIRKLIPSELGLECTERYEEKLEWLYDRLYEDYSQVWFKSLASGGRIHVHDANEVLAILLRDMLLARAELNPSSCRCIIDKFLSDEYRFPLFKKYVLFFVNKYWDDGYSDLLDTILSMPNVLREDAFEVELYDILKTHYLKFSTEQNLKIKSLIDDIPDYYRDDDKCINHWKLKWLSPLKNSEYFKGAFEDARAKSDLEDKKEYEPARDPFRLRMIAGKSSISKDELINKHEAENLVDEFNKFKIEDRWAAFDGEPDREGLGDLLKQAVVDNPKLFSDKIDQYKKAPPYFVHRILWGFNEALRAQKPLDWPNIVTFCYAYIVENKALLADETETEDAKVKNEYSWAIGDAVDLIEDGSNADLLPKECFEKASQIFDEASQIVKGKIDPEIQRDGINYALNTTMGKVVRSNMVFGLRVARETKVKEENWGQKNYERYFGKGVEAFIWFGHYFPQLRYLDQAYAETKLQDLTEKTNTDHEWQAFMEGYLTSSNIYDDIYFLPAMRKHYEKALASKDFDKKDDARLVHHITIEYLRGKEFLAETNADGQQSLFWKLLHEIDVPEKHERWITVAGYFWSISPRTLREVITNNDVEEKPLNSEIIQRILEFWGWTYDKREKIKQLLVDDYNHFLGSLADLTIYLNEIDDVTEKWLLLSAPYCELQHMSNFFIEYLTAFLDDEESVKKIGKIFLNILDGATPTFRDDDIHRIVEGLYKLKDKYPRLKHDADKICNTYGERGQHFLKELYFKNQS